MASATVFVSSASAPTTTPTPTFASAVAAASSAGVGGLDAMDVDGQIDVVHVLERNGKEHTRLGNRHRLTHLQLSLSKALTTSLEDKECKETYVLESVSPESFELIIEWLKHHNGVQPKLPEKPLKSADVTKAWDEWNVQFINKAFPAEPGVGIAQFCNLYSSANYLDIQGLICLCASKMACVVKDKGMEDFAKIVNSATASQASHA